MHKSEHKRILNIVLIPDSQDALPKNLRISYATITFLGVAAGMVFIAMIIGIITYSQVLQAALERNDLRRENLELREQLLKGQQIFAMIDTLQAYRQKVRNSLQGYIKIADKPDEAIIASASFKEEPPRQFSLFSSMPLRTPVSGFISRGFGGAAHAGIDIVAPEGTPIRAAADGMVIFSGWTNQRGNTVIIFHPNGYVTSYQHNSRNTVVEDQQIEQGEVIGFVGNSGESSSGPHLHFEIRRNGKPIDPAIFLTDLNSGD